MISSVDCDMGLKRIKVPQINAKNQEKIFF